MKTQAVVLRSDRRPLIDFGRIPAKALSQLSWCVGGMVAQPQDVEYVFDCGQPDGECPVCCAHLSPDGECPVHGSFNGPHAGTATKLMRQECAHERKLAREHPLPGPAKYAQGLGPYRQRS